MSHFDRHGTEIFLSLNLKTQSVAEAVLAEAKKIRCSPSALVEAALLTLGYGSAVREPEPVVPITRKRKTRLVYEFRTGPDGKAHYVGRPAKKPGPRPKPPVVEDF